MTEVFNVAQKKCSVKKRKPIKVMSPSKLKAALDRLVKLARKAKEEAFEMTLEERVLLTNLYIPTFIESMAKLGMPIGDTDTLEHALELVARVKRCSKRRNK